MSKISNYDNAALLEALVILLHEGTAGTQQEICEALAARGFAINQSKISRSLHKLGAIKTQNAQGQTVYRFSKESAPPATQAQLAQLILKISANESVVVIQTSPGSASLIARMLDYQDSNSEILATLAGDDTIFVAPKSLKRISQTFSEVKQLLAGITNSKTSMIQEKGR